MREIERTIASAIIFSKDGKILMGQKDPNKGGVYSDCWHIPGGGVDEKESLENALKREIKEEIGLDISQYQIEPLLGPGEGVSEKILKETGEKVLCHMKFHRFKIVIDDKTAGEIKLQLGSDLVELRWFSKEELRDVKQIPGGKEYFQELGYIPKEERVNKR